MAARGDPADGRDRDGLSGCPTAEDLRAFLDDCLAAPDEARLTEHVEGCPACGLALESLTAVGSGGEGLRRFLPLAPPRRRRRSTSRATR